MGSKNPVPAIKDALSKAQNPMRPTSLVVVPMSFHAGVETDGGIDVFFRVFGLSAKGSNNM